MAKTDDRLPGLGVVTDVVGVFQIVDLSGEFQGRVVDAAFVVPAAGNDDPVRIGDDRDARRLHDVFDGLDAPPNGEINQLNAVVAERRNVEPLQFRIDCPVVAAALDALEGNGLDQMKRACVAGAHRYNRSYEAGRE